MHFKQRQCRQSYRLWPFPGYLPVGRGRFPALFLGLLFLTSGLAAQPAEVKGRLLDAETAEPLLFATVRVVGTNQNTETDMEGNFSLETDSSATIEFSYVGYQPLEKSVREVLNEPVCVLRAKSANPLPRAVTVWAPRPWFLREDHEVGQLELEKEQLTPYDGLNLATAFDGLPGVQVQQGALNTNRLSIRGVGARTPFSTDQVRVYWNEIPLNDGAGQSAIEDISSGLMRGARVQRGPAGAAYGAGLGGAILLQAQPDNRANWSPALTAAAGSFGRNRQVLSLLNGNSSDDWKQEVTLARTHSDGYRDNNRFDRLSANVLGYKYHEEGTRTLYLAHYQQLSGEIPSSLNAVDFAERPEQAAANWVAVNGREEERQALLGIKHQRLLFRGSEANYLQGRGSLFGGYRGNDEVRPFNVLDESAWQLGGRTVFAWHYVDARHGLPLRAQLGGEWVTESYRARIHETLDGGEKGEQLSRQLERRTQYFLFAEIERLLHPNVPIDVKLSLTLRQNRFRLIEPEVTPRSGEAPDLLPGLQLNYRLTSLLRVFGGWRAGIAYPRPEEWLATWRLTGTELMASRGSNLEVGLRGQRGSWLLEVTVYRMPVNGAFVSRQTPQDETYFINGGETLHQGVELLLENSWLEAPLTLRTTVQYTLGDFRFRDFVNAGSDYSGNQLPGVPRHRLLAHLHLGRGNGFGRLTWDATGRMPVDDANSGFTDGYQLLHLRAGWVSGPKRKVGRAHAWRLYGGINNLFNARYAAMVQVNAQGFGGAPPRYYYPGLPRHFYLGLEWEW